MMQTMQMTQTMHMMPMTTTGLKTLKETEEKIQDNSTEGAGTRCTLKETEG